MRDDHCEGPSPRDVSPAPGATLAPRQDTDASLQMLEESLSGPVAESAVARTRRLEADAALVDYLRRQGFTGAQYQQVIQQLMEYAWRTLSSWSSDGVIFERTTRVGRPVPAHMVQTTWDERDRTQVVTDTVLKGTVIFREHGLVRGKWTPMKGASLTTYFVGASILAFRPVYIRWFNDHRMGQSELDRRTEDTDDALAPQRDIPDQRATDPAHAAATYGDIASLRQLIPDAQLREALSWIALGYTHIDAAQRVGLTAKALERRLARARVRISTSGLSRLQLGEGGTR